MEVVMSTIVVKGNRPLRFFAMMMAFLIVMSHVIGQNDLTENWIFWIMLAMAINAIQATFTGFCPMFKNARGECVACGVSCNSQVCNEDAKQS
jgi:hypothetical protein